MAAAPEVSVIINFYNTEPFLAEAIASVEAQSFTDWELLLVDDGSQDYSAAVAERAVAVDPERRRLLRHPDGGNHGGSAARNLGLAHARGTFVCYLDADDVWFPHKLAYEVEEMRRRPELAMLGSAYRFWYSWDPRAGERDHLRIPGRQLYGDQQRILLPCGETLQPPRAFFELGPAGRAVPPPMPGTIFRSSALRRLGGFVESFRGMLDDGVLFTKFYINTPIALSEEAVMLYRQHAKASMTATSFRTRYRARRAYQAWLADYLKEPQIRALPWYAEVLRSAERTEEDWRRRRVKRRLVSMAEPLVSTKVLVALHKSWVR